MYLASYDPRDLIFNQRELNTGGIQFYFVDGSQNEIIRNRITGEAVFFLSAYLPHYFLSNVIFKFFLTVLSATDPVRFEISVDPYHNFNEDFNADRLQESLYINPQQTIDVNKSSVNRIIQTVSLTYTGLGHKLPKDRCMFKIKQTNLFGSCDLHHILLGGI